MPEHVKHLAGWENDPDALFGQLLHFGVRKNINEVQFCVVMLCIFDDGFSRLVFNCTVLFRFILA